MRHPMSTHTFLLIHNAVSSTALTSHLLSGDFPDFHYLKKKKVAVFSTGHLQHFIEEEERHDRKLLTAGTSQSLRSMSSGERKKALLKYILLSAPEVIILSNPLDNMDHASQQGFKKTFQELSASLQFIQIGTRAIDAFSFITTYYSFTVEGLRKHLDREAFFAAHKTYSPQKIGEVPPPIAPNLPESKVLIEMDSVSVQFGTKPVLKNITWKIQLGEFWQLKGPNGSGKSTLLNLITGDSHKGYGQDLSLFGRKKGSGESVWDLKEHIGYFSPAMIDQFKGYHTLENMLISGLYDSVGLYYSPSDVERRLAEKWLGILGLTAKRSSYFKTLSEGEKRLVMTARAMIKHPPLLLLDEPTIGLDDTSAAFFVALVNSYAVQSTSAIVFVSHREEPGLHPHFIYALHPTLEGAEGKIASA